MMHRPRLAQTRTSLAAMATLKGLAGLALGGLLASCTVLGNKPAPLLHTYTLAAAKAEADAPDTAHASAAPTARRPGSAARVLVVDVPRAAPGYDSARMVYVRQPQTQEAFAHSVWVDTPARMLAPLLLAPLQQSGLFRAVLLAPTAAQSDLRLDTTLLQLEQDFLQVPSRVHLRLQWTLVDNHTHAVLAWHAVDITQNARSEDAAGGALAAQAAVQQGLLELAAFAEAAVAARPAP